MPCSSSGKALFGNLKSIAYSELWLITIDVFLGMKEENFQ